MVDMKENQNIGYKTFWWDEYLSGKNAGKQFWGDAPHIPIAKGLLEFSGPNVHRV